LICWKSGIINDCSNNRRERIAVVVCERSHSMTLPAKIGQFGEIKLILKMLAPELPRFLIAIRCRPVVRASSEAKLFVLPNNQLP
jgi:hypothetical protein